MEQPVPRHKGIYILPNLFTTASLFAGFIGIIWASCGRYEDCALAIFISALMDGLDGKVARLTGTASEFGIQYDSLSDLISFGLTPAVLIFNIGLFQYDRLGIAVAFLFAVCSALRLARFNVSTTIASKRFFTGLPTPAAGCSLAILVLLFPHSFFHSIASLIVTVCLAILMVSRVRFAAFKEFGFLKAHPFRNMVFAILLFALLIINPKVVGAILLYGYIFSGVIYTFILLPRKGKGKK